MGSKVEGRVKTGSKVVVKANMDNKVLSSRVRRKVTSTGKICLVLMVGSLGQLAQAKTLALVQMTMMTIPTELSRPVGTKINQILKVAVLLKAAVALKEVLPLKEEQKQVLPD